MNSFTKLLLVLIFCAAVFTTQAQVYQNIKGLNLRESIPTDVEGSPYLNDKWTEGSAITTIGTFKDIRLKYDISNDQVIFAAKNDEPMGFADPVKEFTLNDKVFANGFPAIGAQGKDSYYQIISEGKIALLKRLVKKVQQSKAYGAATMTKQFVTIEAYYIFKDNTMEGIRPDKKSILSLMADKADLMEAYLKTNKVSFKNDADLGKLFDYYKGLK